MITKNEFDTAQTELARKEVKDILDKVEFSLKAGSTHIKLNREYRTPWKILEAEVTRTLEAAGWEVGISTYGSTSGSQWDSYSVVYKQIHLS